MKLICNKTMLVNKINIAQKGVASKNVSEALSHLLLTAVSNNLSIVGYNLETAITATMDVDLEVSGSVLVESRLFGDIVRKLPDEMVFLEVLKEENLLLIKSGSSSFKISTGDCSEYPTIPTISDKHEFSLNSLIFKKMINETKFALSQDLTKPALTCAYLEVKTNSVSMVALDGYRMAVSKEELPIGIKDDLNILIPGKVLNDISSILNKNEFDITFKTDFKLLKISFDDIEFITQLVVDDYIDYKKLIPKDTNTKVTVNRKTLSEVIDRASLVSINNKNNLVHLSINDGKIDISTNSDIATSKESIDVEQYGDNLDIAFNSRYLNEALKVMTSENVVLDFTSNVNPGVIVPADDTKYLYLVLPVRIAQK